MLAHARHRLGIAAGLALLVLGFTLTGAAAFAASSSGNTTANISVNDVITLSGLTSSFTLTGDPGATVTGNSKVAMNVLTNNPTGYTVTVQSAAANLVGTGSNTNTIPIAALQVRETSGVAFTPLSNAAAVPVHAQLTPSGASGDSLSNDYRVTIPFVNADTYSAQLNYVAATT